MFGLVTGLIFTTSLASAGVGVVSGIDCCTPGGECTAAPAEEGCRATAPTPPTAPATDDSRRTEETRAPPSWFLTHDAPYMTTRGWLAEALKKRGVEAVFAGTIEGEYAFEGQSSRWRWGILTWCTIRVEKVWKGDLKPGDTVELLYHGGSLGRGYSSYPSHEPRCLPLDYGVFSTLMIDDVRMPIPLATVSMIGSGLEIAQHPITRDLDVMAPVLLPKQGAKPSVKPTPKGAKGDRE